MALTLGRSVDSTLKILILISGLIYTVVGEEGGYSNTVAGIPTYSFVLAVTFPSAILVGVLWCLCMNKVLGIRPGSVPTQPTRAAVKSQYRRQLRPPRPPTPDSTPPSTP